jgi:hypothetical protein
VFQSGDTWQDAIALTGAWCGSAAETQSIGTLSGSINSSVTSLALSSSASVGVGDVLKLDSEYVVVRGQGLATTSQTLQTPLTASAAGTSVAVTTGSSYAIGETITLDAERMLVVDISGNTLIVKRAFDGSVLASHTGSTIYAPRVYTVDRGACGSTAASHTSGITVYQHVIPAPVQSLCLAEASWIYAGNSQGWALSNSITHNVLTEQALKVLVDHREQVRTSHGRKMRQRAV